MTANARGKQFLLSTAAFLGALAGYGGRAYAQCAPATTPSGPTVTCAGGPFNTPVDVDNTANANESLAVSTTAAFQVYVNTLTDTALTITGNGAVSFIDTFSDSYLLSDAGSGLIITSTGDTTPTNTAGSIYVNSQGKFYGGGGDGISAYNNGSGNIDIRIYGAYVTGSYRGIYAYNGNSAKDLSVTTGPVSEITGESYGIYVSNSGAGSTTITANGEVTATYGTGIDARNGNSAKDLSVTTGSGSKITGSYYGIYVSNSGTGSTTITANGEVTATYDGPGIYALNGSSAKNLTVITGVGSKVLGYYNGAKVDE